MFQNIRQVIVAESWCRENNLAVKVIPVPKPYSTECGMCLELDQTDRERLEKFAKEKGFEPRII